MEVNQMKLKTASSAQRSFLRKPSTMEAKSIVDKVLDSESKSAIRGMTMAQREQAERKSVLKLVNQLISQKEFFISVDEARALNLKINALRARLRAMFNLIRNVMAAYRGGLRAFYFRRNFN